VLLVGQYDSPFVRRVAVSLRLLGLPYEHSTISVFADAEAMRRINPLGRIPSLRLDDGETLIDSAAILDWRDETAGPERALLPPHGPARRRALRQMALATGVIDKLGQATYERLLRPAERQWPEWIARCRLQATGGLDALEAETGEGWLGGRRIMQPDITAACALFYIGLADPGFLEAGHWPKLRALAERCEALPEFAATRPEAYTLPAPR
jgi:glutathione S-transferase